MRKICTVCSIEYSTYNRKSRFCSRRCRGVSELVFKTTEGADKWFWPNVLIGEPTECWPWTASIKDNGYGIVTHFEGRTEYAHRISFLLANGRLPNGDTRHTCDTRPCCNQRHLIEGSRAQNVADAVSRKRHAHGEKNGTAKLTRADVAAIHASLLPHTVLARQLDVHPTTVLRVRRGQTWINP